MSRTKKITTPIVLPASVIVGYKSSLGTHALCLRCYENTSYKEMYQWTPLYDTDIVARSIYCTNEPGEHVGIVCRQFKDIAEIVTANKVRHQHFFDRGALDFFDSRVYSTVYGGRYFVTSEQFHDSRGYSAPRSYTVRKCVFGNIETVGGFNEIPTLARAKAIATALAEGYTKEAALRAADEISVDAPASDYVALRSYWY